MEWFVYGIWFGCGYVCKKMIDHIEYVKTEIKFNNLTEVEKEKALKTFVNDKLNRRS